MEVSNSRNKHKIMYLICARLKVLNSKINNFVDEHFHGLVQSLNHMVTVYQKLIYMKCVVDLLRGPHNHTRQMF